MRSWSNSEKQKGEQGLARGGGDGRNVELAFEGWRVSVLEEDRPWTGRGDGR